MQATPHLKLTRHTPDDAQFDSNGYVIPPKGEWGTTTWAGRFMTNLGNGESRMIEKQREMGYKVYDKDPGNYPTYMPLHQQNEINKVFWETVCTII